MTMQAKREDAAQTTRQSSSAPAVHIAWERRGIAAVPIAVAAIVIAHLVAKVAFGVLAIDETVPAFYLAAVASAVAIAVTMVSGTAQTSRWAAPGALLVSIGAALTAGEGAFPAMALGASLVNLAALRAPFAPSSYVPASTLWLLSLLAPELRARAGRVVVMTVAWILIPDCRRPHRRSPIWSPPYSCRAVSWPPMCGSSSAPSHARRSRLRQDRLPPPAEEHGDGAAPKAIQELGGHSTLAMTMRTCTLPRSRFVRRSNF